ncbi:MAG: hypothetical protein WD341_14980 [Tistlia sp.]|uniref:hypothetical protein n=1 Tax=Tistlia sp. TaxID=3057121 RepID=UPI0034A21D0D
MVEERTPHRSPDVTGRPPARYRLLAACLCLAGALLAAPEARAVVSTSGIIEIDDGLDRSTTDIQYFDISAPAIDADFLISVVSPTPTDSIAAALFGLTPGGDFSPLIEIEGGAPGLDSFVMTNSLGVGSYAFVVGLFELSLGEYPPFQTDPNTPTGIASIEYEISITGFDDRVTFTCRREGNLDGSETFQAFVPGAFCPPPPTVVDEPAAALLLLAGLAGLGGLLLVRGRRAAQAT